MIPTMAKFVATGAVLVLVGTTTWWACTSDSPTEERPGQQYETPPEPSLTQREPFSLQTPSGQDLKARGVPRTAEGEVQTPSRLHPDTGSIQATITDAGIPVTDITVRAKTAHAIPAQPADRASSAGSQPLTWSATTNAEGEVELLGLPAETPVHIAFHRGTELVSELSWSPELKRGEQMVAKWNLGRGCTLRGIAVDQDGLPVKGMEIWVDPSLSNEARYFIAFHGICGPNPTFTDEEGRFTYTNVFPGFWHYGPAGVDAENYWTDLNPDSPFAGHDRPEPERIAPFAQVAVVEHAHQVVDVRLNVFRGLYIRGTLVDAHGAPAGSKVVEVKKVGLSTYQLFETDPSGEFLAGPLVPGPHELRAYGSGLSATSAPVIAHAGSRNIKLQLQLGGIVQGRVLDADSGEGCVARLRMIPVEDPDPAGRWHASSNRTGSFANEGLKPGTYHLIAATPDARIGLVRNLTIEADRVLDEVDVPVRPGGLLRVRSGNGKTHEFTLHHEGLWAGCGFTSPNRVSSQVLFPGWTQVHYTANGGGRIDVYAAVGETVEIMIPPED